LCGSDTLGTSDLLITGKVVCLTSIAQAEVGEKPTCNVRFVGVECRRFGCFAGHFAAAIVYIWRASGRNNSGYREADDERLSREIICLSQRDLPVENHKKSSK